MLQSAKDQLAQLAFDFKVHSYRQLNESQTRLSYIDRFWEILGWNVRNTAEVQVETTDKQSKRPDYRFVKGKKTLFFVEAKKPAEDLKNPKHIYQTKLYCWNGNVPLAILTDFEEFRPFRSVGKPDEKNPNKGLIKNLDIMFDQYADMADELLSTFGKEAVDGGSIAKLVKATQAEIRDTVDKDFLNTITRWRLALAEKIASTNRFENEFQLSESVQRILDRLVFMRIIQDKGIEDRNYLSQIAESRARDTYAEFVNVCKELAPKYNGLIFNPHPTSENLTVETTLFKRIVKEMMPEESPYRFDEIPVEMLGTIYERFLGDEISFDKKGKISIDQKPEVRKAGGVYYTPQYIVEYIVENTVGKLLEKCKTPDDVAKLKILDPACGSGSFLLGAFDKLIAWHEDYFAASPQKAVESKKNQGFLLARLDAAERMRLTTRMKGKILQNNIFGVDLDKQATEVAQMSLYIRVLEGYAEEPQTLGFKEAILPKMEGNIKCGNSLIGTDFIQDDFFGLSEREKHKINPFDWEDQFPTVFRREGDSDGLQAFHVTWATHESRKVNPNDRASEVILDKLSREQIAKFLDEKIAENKYRVLEANILSDHVHLLIVCPDDDLADVVRNIKGYTSYMLHRNTDDANLRVNPEVDQRQYSDGTIKKLWASGFDKREINDNEYLENVQQYIRHNHAKHEIEPIEYRFRNLTNTAQAFAPASNSGFDAVIGNPPYIKIQTMQESNPKSVEYLKQNYYSAKSNNIDIYVSFLEKALQLINSKGMTGYILPHKFFQSQMGENIRNLIGRKQAINKIVSFGANQIFDSATTYTCLFFCDQKPNSEFKYFEFKLGDEIEKELRSINFITIDSAVLGKDKWNFFDNSYQQFFDKLNRIPLKLKDITRKIFVGLQTSADKIYVLKRTDPNDKDLIPVFSKSLEREVLIERGLLKPFLMGKDVKRYMPLEHNVYVIFPYTVSNGKAELMSSNYIKEHFPLGWQYLLENKAELENREKGKFKETWWQYGRTNNLSEFDCRKIITPYLSDKCNFTYDINGDKYHTTKAYSISFNANADLDKYAYLGILNSRLVWWFITQTSSVFRGGFFVFATDFLSTIPIPPAPPREKHDRLVSLVERMLELHAKLAAATEFDRKHLEAYIARTDREIDAIVYELYGLTDEEIRIVEGNTGS